MISTILVIFLILLGVALLAKGKITLQEPIESDGYRRGQVGKYLNLRPWSAVPFGLAVVLLILTVFTIVQAKQVGVLTTFGKPSDRTLGPGLHAKAPWQKNTQLDGTIQTDEYRGDDCIYVRLGDGQTSCVSTTIRWRISLDEADTIYSDYRSDDPTESLRKAVVSTQFKSAVNDVLGDYNPTAVLEALDPSDPDAMTEEVSFAPDYDGLAKQISSQMDERLSAKGEPLVLIDSITISYLKLSDKTQAKIDAYQSEVANTRLAIQKQATNTALAEANEILAASISKDANVLVSRCLDLIEDGFAPPAGFSCWQGSGSSVVLPAAK